MSLETHLSVKQICCILCVGESALPRAAQHNPRKGAFSGVKLKWEVYVKLEGEVPHFDFAIFPWEFRISEEFPGAQDLWVIKVS